MKYFGVDTPPANLIVVYQTAGSLMDNLPSSVDTVCDRIHYGPVPPE